MRSHILLSAFSLFASFCSGRSGQVAAIVVAAYYLCSGRSGRIIERVVMILKYSATAQIIGGHYNGHYLAATATTGVRQHIDESDSAVGLKDLRSLDICACVFVFTLSTPQET